MQALLADFDSLLEYEERSNIELSGWTVLLIAGIVETERVLSHILVSTLAWVRGVVYGREARGSVTIKVERLGMCIAETDAVRSIGRSQHKNLHRPYASNLPISDLRVLKLRVCTVNSILVSGGLLEELTAVLSIWGLGIDKFIMRLPLELYSDISALSFHLCKELLTATGDMI
ncbi:hypothetical protein Tco_0861245 [Tanacetum coccineum]|uniref:Uncharacterized protein n=1 Tax=Tanacetum coccineum TaxID=301880 RepID=A0ABQ5BKB0_9ASTR